MNFIGLRKETVQVSVCRKFYGSKFWSLEEWKHGNAIIYNYILSNQSSYIFPPSLLQICDASI